MVRDTLDEAEVDVIMQQIDAAMKTANGDTGPVTISARQAMILLEAFAENEIARANRGLKEWLTRRDILPPRGAKVMLRSTKVPGKKS